MTRAAEEVQAVCEHQGFTLRDTNGKNLVQSCTQPDYRKSVGLVLQAVLVAKRQLNLSLSDVKAWRYIHCASQCDH